MILKEIFRAIISPELQAALLPLKIVVIFLSFLMLWAIIYFLLRTSYLKYLFLDSWSDYLYWKKTYGRKAVKKSRHLLDSANSPTPDEPKEKSGAGEDSQQEKEIDLKNGRVERTDWERILDKLESGKALNYKLALIDADKMLNKVLKQEGKELLPKFVSNIDEINRVKEFLEKIFENPKAKLSLEETKKAIAIYQKALSELKAI